MARPADGQFVEVASDTLVPGDVVEVPRHGCMMMVDAVLKELGRAEATLASTNREPVLTSPHFVSQYFTSFCEDPILKALEKETEGDVDETEKNETSGYLKAMECMRQEKYDDIVTFCNEELDLNGDGFVDGQDMTRLFELWGPCPE